MTTTHTGHVAITPREGLQGALDRMALVDAAATSDSLSREVRNIALRICRNSGSRIDEQVAAIEAFLVNVKYRREPADMLQKSAETAELGGDCDCATRLGLALFRALPTLGDYETEENARTRAALALFRTLAVPVEPQLMATADGNAFHIRLVVYLPPVGEPTHGYAVYPYAIDPVRFSEAEWALVDIPPEQWKLDPNRLQRLAGNRAFAGLIR